MDHDGSTVEYDCMGAPFKQPPKNTAGVKCTFSASGIKHFDFVLARRLHRTSIIRRVQVVIQLILLCGRAETRPDDSLSGWLTDPNVQQRECQGLSDTILSQFSPLSLLLVGEMCVPGTCS